MKNSFDVFLQSVDNEEKTEAEIDEFDSNAICRYVIEIVQFLLWQQSSLWMWTDLDLLSLNKLRRFLFITNDENFLQYSLGGFNETKIDKWIHILHGWLISTI